MTVILRMQIWTRQRNKRTTAASNCQTARLPDCELQHVITRTLQLFIFLAHSSHFPFLSFFPSSSSRLPAFACFFWRSRWYFALLVFFSSRNITMASTNIRPNAKHPPLRIDVDMITEDIGKLHRQYPRGVDAVKGYHKQATNMTRAEQKEYKELLVSRANW